MRTSLWSIAWSEPKLALEAWTCTRSVKAFTASPTFCFAVRSELRFVCKSGPAHTPPRGFECHLPPSGQQPCTMTSGNCACAHVAKNAARYTLNWCRRGGPAHTTVLVQDQRFSRARTKPAPAGAASTLRKERQLSTLLHIDWCTEAADGLISISPFKQLCCA